METVSDFTFGGSQITADGDCSHEIKRRLLFGRKVMTNLYSILKRRDICLSDLKTYVHTEILMKVKKESEKVGLKLNIQKTKIIASGPITSWEIDGKQWRQCQTLFFWAPESLQMVTAAMKLKDVCLLLGRKVMTNLDSILKSKILLCQQRSI